MTASALMVWGASSHAGKSLVATALCRWAARAGLDVAPFKAQNMSNHARVVPTADGGFGEIGSAQYFQALAARVAPSVDMNPVLLKPESDTASQVVVHGRVDAALSRQPWRTRAPALAQHAQASYARLAARHALVVIEGAGSPAEINLAEDDYVNLHAMRWSGAQALLVVDIDRGGAFAHAFGTWALLPDDLRPRLAGYLLNKFRGDPALLAPGPQMLTARCGLPLLGVLPMLPTHGLPEEDGVMSLAPTSHANPADPPAAGVLDIIVITPPRASNLDEFAPLRALPGVRLRWARTVAEAQGEGWLVLPGSKQVSGDLAWLRAHGLAEFVRSEAARGRPILGICGGLQMLGARLVDTEGADGAAGVDVPGLGLLPIETHYAGAKRVRPSVAHWHGTHGAWAGLAGLCSPGYEIRIGRSNAVPANAAAHVAAVADDGVPLAWQHGNVLGTALHGLFESPATLTALTGAVAPDREAAFDALADALEHAMGRATLERLTGAGAPR